MHRTTPPGERARATVAPPPPWCARTEISADQMLAARSCLDKYFPLVDWFSGQRQAVAFVHPPFERALPVAPARLPAYRSVMRCPSRVEGGPLHSNGQPYPAV